MTIIKGEGEETKSPPARAGDWVVRNRCPDTGNEQYLVGGPKFVARYTPNSRAADANGWQEFRPVGKPLRALSLAPDEAPFRFRAPWGGWEVAHPGDFLVQDPDDPADTYRVSAVSFGCTYEVVT